MIGFLKRQYFVLFLMFGLWLKLCFFTRSIGFEYGLSMMWIGYAFSLLFSMVVFSPLLFIRKYKKPITLFIAFLLAFGLYLDLLYFRFFQSLPTFGLMDAINQTGDIAPEVSTLVKWTDFWLFLDLIILLGFEGFARLSGKLSWQREYREAKVGRGEKGFVVGVLFILLALSVTFSVIPAPHQKLADALSWSFETKYNTRFFGIMGGHIIDGYRFVDEKLTTISPQEKKSVIGWVGKNLKKESPRTPYTGVAAGKRVIIVQVESLGNFVIDGKYGGKEVTPNLNKFKKGSYYFSNNRFVIGSGHTSDTDLVINSSLYPLYDSAAFVRFGKDDFSGLPKALAGSGYTSSAYHAYNRNFWNRSVAFKSLGYHRFYAAESFPKGTMINMNGLNDSDFLSKTADYIKEGPKKSLSYTITLSSHYPFTITPQTKGLGLNPDSLPAFVGGYLENINYTDRAIGSFFEKLKNQGLYDDSLIIFLGDHSPTMNDFSSGNLAFKMDSEDTKKAPLFIKLPGQKVGVEETGISTDMDIMPTILDLLGVKSTGIMFGQSLFLPKAKALPRCSEGEVIHVGGVKDCGTEINIEKAMSAKIIKYNLFSEL